MKGDLTAVIEPAPEGGFWAICLEIAGANGQAESIEEARQDLQAAIELLREDHAADIIRALPSVRSVSRWGGRVTREPSVHGDVDR